MLKTISKDNLDNESFKFGTAKYINIDGTNVWAQRLSYVGELGFELYVKLDDAKKIYEYAIIYKFLSKSKQNADWVLYSEKLKETLRQLDLSSEKNQQLPYNESEIIPLIDSIKDLVTEIPETDDDK